MTDRPACAREMSFAEEEKLELYRTTTRDSDHKMDHKTTRRRSNDPKVNVYTECGRHGDDWLFGGFSLSETMKMLWEKRG